MTVMQPGDELATIDNADLSHAGNVTGDRVKVPGDEMARIWPAPLPGLPPWPPVASFTWTPANPSPSTVVTFDGSASHPGEMSEPVTRYDWQFDTYAAMPDAGSVVTWKLPSGHGSYVVTLVVTAADGQQGSQSQVLGPVLAARRARART